MIGREEYHEFHESAEELRMTHADPKHCPVGGIDNCRWLVHHRLLKEWGVENGFLCSIQSSKYNEDQCPLFYNICKKCGEIIPEDDTVWIDKMSLHASSPPNKNAEPYHVECAPEELESM